MIGGFARILDNLLGRGEAAVTVPPLDGALRPNRILDEQGLRVPLADVDSLAVLGGKIVVSAADALYTMEEDGHLTVRSRYPHEIACIAPTGEGALAVALSSGEIIMEGGDFDGRRYKVEPKLGCITAVTVSGSELYVANGSATNAASDWARDLLERNASGSIWRIDLESGRGSRLADGLAFPAGLVIEGGDLVCSEAWRHRLVRIAVSSPSWPRTIISDLPGYPGRITPAGDGYWLAAFAPRSQLVEFVLREPAYRRRMMAEVPPQYWVAPKLRSGRSFYESLQGGGVKHLGLLKPWAPTMSAGLAIRLDRGFRPVASLQSRADGATHGVTTVVELDARVFAAARGDGVLVVLDPAEVGGPQ
jgi:hypothetical protein